MKKDLICVVSGAVGSAFAGAFGGWSQALTTLCVFMAVDYVSGLVCAGVFHSSPKSESGALESNAGFKGLVRKGMILTVILICHQLDMELGVNFVRDGACVAFTVNEGISLIENAGLMGVPIPDVVLRGIEALKDNRQ